ncbi:hypothetical protein ABT218_23605, partial [Streptomyces sp. NPDC001455]|uniref:hypothetical protein n=1 Tax=Streptomyces sp. NPDC001455 TaxID=3154518 RepID=UPI003332505F
LGITRTFIPAQDDRQVALELRHPGRDEARSGLRFDNSDGSTAPRARPERDEARSGLRFDNSEPRLDRVEERGGRSGRHRVHRGGRRARRGRVVLPVG